MPGSGNSTGTRSILVVEDEELVGLSLCEALREAGFGAMYCSTGRSALDAAAASPFVAAIIDVGLPDMAGDAVARELRVRHATLPMILCTGFETERYQLSFRDDDLVRVIAKPFDDRLLLARLARLGVRGDGALPTGVARR